MGRNGRINGESTTKRGTNVGCTKTHARNFNYYRKNEGSHRILSSVYARYDSQSLGKGESEKRKAKKDRLY